MWRRAPLVLVGFFACLLTMLLVPSPARADQCTKDTCVDRDAFYRGYRKFNRRHPLAQDPKKFRERQFVAMQDILDHWDTSEELTDTRWLAYIVATVFWETGGFLYPVREGLCDDAECAIAHLEKLWRRRMVRQRYWEPDPKTGESYYGRGQVQLTHLRNYWRVGGELTRTQEAGDFDDFDTKLVNQPDLALKDWVSTTALVEGMVLGWYNIEIGKGLASYINENARNDRAGYLEARRTVNGLDKRDLLADFALEIHKFVKAVPASSVKTVDVADVTSDIEGGTSVPNEETDGRVRRRRGADAVDTGQRIGPVSGPDDEPVRSTERTIDFEHPVGPIRNLGGVAGGGTAAASRGELRTAPTKKQIRERKKRKRKRERRRRKRQRQQKKNQRR